MEARTIGERYRDGNPVIMNLTDMSDADAKRWSIRGRVGLRDARRHGQGDQQSVLDLTAGC